ncbi:MAG: outer membrane lipoprotein chaperone LolA [Motiliproteus sp.]
MLNCSIGRYATRLIALISLCVITSVASAESMSGSTAGQNLNRLLAGVGSLSASFEQTVLDGGGTRLQQSHGELLLARPGKFRWSTAEPFPQLLVSDGDTLWIYDQDLEQVTQQAVDKRLTNTPALLLSGDLESLQQSFQISGPLSGDNGNYRLTPIDEEAMFSTLLIAFKDGLPVEMQLEDSLGQKTSLNFNDLVLNPDVSDAEFVFQVPDGVDLIAE